MISNVECIGRHCVYDNPETCQREAWLNGRIVQMASKDMIDDVMQYAQYPITLMSWESGRIIGDPDAMKTGSSK